MFLLLNSKLRRKLLTYSFTHPDENYYVRELSNLINEDPGNLSRELRRLEDEGLYTSMIKGRVKIFSLNKRYPLFKELKKMKISTEAYPQFNFHMGAACREMGLIDEAIEQFKVALEKGQNPLGAAHSLDTITLCRGWYQKS